MNLRSNKSRLPGAVLATGALLLGAGLLATLAPAAHLYQPAEVQPIWLKIDLDNDGKISPDELREEDVRLLSKFDSADLDHDGKLSLRELELLLLSV